MNTSTMLHSLKHLYRGKVRDSYEVDDDHILMVVSDRISAFDVVFDDPIPNKGKILQALTDFGSKRSVICFPIISPAYHQNRLSDLMK